VSAATTLTITDGLLDPFREANPDLELTKAIKAFREFQAQ
jgi:hypothetical protein